MWQHREIKGRYIPGRQRCVGLSEQPIQSPVLHFAVQHSTSFMRLCYPNSTLSILLPSHK
jgi:hypothetical protein